MNALLLPLPAQQPDDVRYGRDIRPLLSDRCFRCHGPDAGTRKADLRLDERDAALAARDEGAAIVPGDPAKSLLLARIAHPDPEERMPPPESGKPTFRPDEIELVRRWIAAGAPYEEHWSFVAPVRAEVPADAGNAIDYFVQRDRRRAGLTANPPADRATLARRLFLVLTGLPPTPEELLAFLDDARPDAYERLVDRLLDEEPYRTRHAEHLATPWLDAARYADTSGIHMDAGRQIWPWRDWLITALRDDMPFDQFVVEQLAGDLLPNATVSQQVATGFLRNHVTTDEGGAIDEEYRVEYAAERTATLGSVFLGLTLGCARCHDHKYDPIRQEDFYRLFSFFNSNDEPGLYSQSKDPNRALEPAIEVPSPQIEQQRARVEQELAAARAELQTEVPGEAAQRGAFFADLLQQSQLDWRALVPTSATSTRGATLTLQDDGSVLASGANPPTDHQVLLCRSEADDLRLISLEALADPSLPEGKVGRAPNGNAVLSALRVEVRDGDAWRRVPLLWVAADIEQQNGDFAVVNALADDGRGWAVNAHGFEAGPRRALFVADQPFAAKGDELRITLVYDSVYPQHVFGRVRLHASPAAPELLDRLPLARSGFYVAGPFADEDRARLYTAAHGPGEATRIDPQARWQELAWRFEEDIREGTPFAKLPQGSNATYVGQRVFAPTARKLRMALGSDDGFRLFVDGKQVAERRVDRAVGADQDRVEVEHARGEGVLVLGVVNTGGIGGCYLRREPRDGELPGDTWLALLPQQSFDAALAARRDGAWRQFHSPGYRERVDAVARLETELATVTASMPQTMVMRQAMKPRQTYVLQRGEYDKPDKDRPVASELPLMFGALPAGAPHNRLGLAQWLVSERDPLLLRVAANRLWEFVFGTGIVRTSEDFGRQGEWPSHPELLDWLAVELRENGFRQRAILRQLVLSDTFRQDSRVDPAARERDPDNRLLARFPRRRLGAEALRDQALYVAGLLIERVGGPSVKPYQPEGLWREVAMVQSNTRTFTRGNGDELWRRSLYTYWKRACPPPSLLTFDAPTREFCTVRRLTTNTPLQALVLWNDEQFVEAARTLAQRTLAEVAEPTARLQSMFLRCTGHAMDAAGLQRARDTLTGLRKRYAAAPRDAEALLAVGEHPRPEEIDPAELAAYTLVANAFLNLDATLYID
ncbi:MAG: PSD1 domain-containing protein [Planctomycetes bacterium]|nr:PSD1 domain-containing protein [Planctomycetota bacterium]